MNLFFKAAAAHFGFLLSCMAAAALVVPCTDLFAVRNRFYDDESAVIIKEVRDSIDDIRHEVNNHETEIRTFDEKLINFESIIESVRDQIQDFSQAHKEQIKGSAASLDAKIAALELLSKGLVADLRQFKSHSNEVTTVLGQYKQKISDLEKTVEKQSQNIDHLQSAMKALMEAFQARDTGPGASKGVFTAGDVPTAGLYRVKAGDSLEKIARNYQTSVAVLKEMNGLATDRITVGQLIKVPEK